MSYFGSRLRSLFQQQDFRVHVQVKGTGFSAADCERWNPQTLYDCVASCTSKDVKHFKLHLDNGKLLDMNDTELIDDYDLESRLNVVYKYNIFPLEGYVGLSTKPCWLTSTCDWHEERAEMPCRCVFSVDAVAQLQVASGGCSVIKCPRCGVEWEDFVVNHVAQVAVEESVMSVRRRPFTVNIDVQGSSLRLTVYGCWTTEALYHLVAFAVNRNVNDFALYTLDANVRLFPDNSLYLKDYNLRRHTNITYKYNISPLEGYIRPSIEQCCLTYDDDLLETRAQMPCGCIFSVDALDHRCKDVLKSGVRLGCHHCGTKWDFFVVRHVLQVCKTSAELLDMSDRLNKAFIHTLDVRLCPSCQTICQLDLSQPCQQLPATGNGNKIVCGICSRKRRREYGFCWQCGREWKGAMTGWCGNGSCERQENRIVNTLASCEILTGPDHMVGCPKIRACPRCGYLIEYLSNCKHMQCRSCKTDFCFVCLRLKSGDRWLDSCSRPNGKCPVAARQT